MEIYNLGSDHQVTPASAGTVTKMKIWRPLAHPSKEQPGRLEENLPI